MLLFRNLVIIAFCQSFVRIASILIYSNNPSTVGKPRDDDAAYTAGQHILALGVHYTGGLDHNTELECRR